MKKSIKRIMIVVVAAVFALSVQLSVSAETGLPTNLEEMSKWIQQILNGMTTTQPPDVPPTTDPNNPTATTDPNNPTATTDPNNPTATTDPINNQGTGSYQTTEPTTEPIYTPITPGQEDPTTVFDPNATTEPEESSLSGSLAQLLEQDSAAVIIQAPTETFTISGLVVNNNNQPKDEGLTWQQIALIGAAVLFVIFAALIVALLVQRSKRLKEEEEENRRMRNSSSSSSAGVPVEVMSPERIAELLGSANKGAYVSGGADAVNSVNAAGFPAGIDLTSEESAAAIKTAILMGQLSHTYSDPLLRKYTEEPVVISPVMKINPDAGVTGAEILEATDSMLSDITGNEKYASDVSGMTVPSENLDEILAETKTKECPECHGAVASGDVFCHSCGAYVG